MCVDACHGRLNVYAPFSLLYIICFFLLLKQCIILINNLGISFYDFCCFGQVVAEQKGWTMQVNDKDKRRRVKNCDELLPSVRVGEDKLFIGLITMLSSMLWVVKLIWVDVCRQLNRCILLFMVIFDLE